MVDPTRVKVGPGLLYLGPLGTTIPTDLTTPWATVDADWLGIGYTEEGHEASIAPNFEPIEVAEELTPIRYEETNREIGLAFAAAEMTRRNIVSAMNGGTVTTIAGTVVRIEPPALGTVTKCMIGWESQDSTERWIFKQCVQTGAVAIARRKAPAKATIPMEFRCEKPAGTQPFEIIFDEA